MVVRELKRAAVWFGLALLIAGVIVLAQPLLLIIGGMVFAVFLDGGARLIGRVLPIGRGFRLALALMIGFGFIGWVFWYAGTTIAAQFEALRIVVTAQFDRLMGVRGIARPHPERAAVQSRLAAARVRRPPDQRGRQRARRDHQRHPDAGDRHFPGDRAAHLRPRNRLDAAASAPRAILPDRRPCRLHLAPPAVRPPARHDLRRLLHLVHARLRLAIVRAPADSDGGAAGADHRHARLHPQYRCDHFRRADGRGRVQRRPERGSVRDLRLFLRAERRRLSGHSVHRPPDGRPRPGNRARQCNC